MPIVTVFGGSGFIGRYVAKKLAKQGWRVRCAVRRPNEALFLRPYGDVGQVEPIQANVRDEASTLRAIRGADAVINLVAILYPTGKQTFEAVQFEGAERIANWIIPVAKRAFDDFADGGTDEAANRRSGSVDQPSRISM